MQRSKIAAHAAKQIAAQLTGSPLLQRLLHLPSHLLMDDILNALAALKADVMSLRGEHSAALAGVEASMEAIEAMVTARGGAAAPAAAAAAAPAAVAPAGASTAAEVPLRIPFEAVDARNYLKTNPPKGAIVAGAR